LAYSAADTFFSLNPNCSIGILQNSANGTDQQAFRIITMPANGKEHFSFDP
jgi:hypothetical protein